MIPGWVDRVWVWISDATDGITWLIALCLFASGFGFTFVPVDWHDRNQARALQSQGEWVTAQEVQVRVNDVRGRGGGYSEVDGVRVRLAGSAGQVELDNVDAAEDNAIYDEIREGWQEPTAVTRYEPPLDVRLQRAADGTIVSAMARADYEYWTEDNRDPEFGLTLGFSALGLTATLLALNALRLAWQTRPSRKLSARQARHEAERRARVAATGKRGRR